MSSLPPRPPSLYCTDLDKLDLRFRPKAVELIARAAEWRVPVQIVQTLRTPEEQALFVRTGRSWTPFSKHLPDPVSGLSRAIDISPYEVYQLNGPDKPVQRASDPVWQVLGQIGEALGLRWGGRWKVPDCYHFELI